MSNETEDRRSPMGDIDPATGERWGNPGPAAWALGGSVVMFMIGLVAAAYYLICG